MLISWMLSWEIYHDMAFNIVPGSLRKEVEGEGGTSPPSHHYISVILTYPRCVNLSLEALRFQRAH